MEEKSGSYVNRLGWIKERFFLRRENRLEDVKKKGNRRERRGHKKKG